jgi:hypothetical protein
MSEEPVSMRFSSMFIELARRFRAKLMAESRAGAVITLSHFFLDEHTMARAIRLAIVALVLAGCGLKGPLTLPEPDVNPQKEQKK